MRPLEVVGVVVDLPSPYPVLVLRETDGQGRQLHVPIGFPEASAIAAALRQIPWPRPVTQQLLADILSEYSIQVEQAVISAVREGTYYAHLDLVGREEERRVLTCRPSDAVGLLLRLPGAGPLLAVDDVMDRYGVAGSPSPGPEDLPGGDGSGEDVLLVGDPGHQGDEYVVGHEGGAPVGHEGQGHPGNGE